MIPFARKSRKQLNDLNDLAQKVKRNPEDAMHTEFFIAEMCNNLKEFKLPGMQAFAYDIGIAAPSSDKAALCAQIRAKLRDIAKKPTEPGWFSWFGNKIKEMWNWKTAAAALGGFSIACQSSYLQNTAPCKFWNESIRGAWEALKAPTRELSEWYQGTQESEHRRHKEKYKAEEELTYAKEKLSYAQAEQLKATAKLVLRCMQRDKQFAAHMQERMKDKLSDYETLNKLKKALGVSLEMAKSLSEYIASYALGGLKYGPWVQTVLNWFQNRTEKELMSDVDKICGVLSKE